MSESSVEVAAAKVWNDRTGPSELLADVLAPGAGLRFLRLVDGVPVELRWDQPAPGDGRSARATWSVWVDGSMRTSGHLESGKAVRVYREGRAFDAWWTGGARAST